MSRETFDLKLVYITIALISLVVIFNYNQIDALTQTNNFNNGSGTGFNGNVWTEKFSGLPAGGSISQLSLNVSASGKAVSQDHAWTGSVADPRGSIWAEKFTGLPVGANITGLGVWQNNVGTTFIRAKLYNADGVGYHQGTTIHNYKALHGDFTGAVWAEKFTGLLAGGQVTQINFWTGSCGSGFYDVRVKVYQDDGTGGNPSTLLGEGVGTGGCGGAVVGVAVTATVPASGNIWAGIECKSNTKPCDIGYSSGLANGTAVTANHVYGLGPSPFGTATGQTSAPYLEVLADDYTISGYPSTLQAESGSIQVPTINQFSSIPITGIVPACGCLWGAFEVTQGTGTPSYQYLNSPPASNSAITVSHSYGTGPNPFGRASNGTAFAMQLIYNQGSQVRAKIYQDNGQLATHTALHNNQVATSTSGGGNEYWLEKFTGLTAGANLTSIQQWTIGGVNNNVKLYDDTGIFVHEASAGFCPTYAGSPVCGGAGNFNSGNMYLTKATGLPVGKTITGIQNSAGIGSLQFGHIRVYADDAGSHGGTAGYPYTLLGDSMGLGQAGGLQSGNYGVIPSDGNVWMSIQYNQSTALVYNSGEAGHGLACPASIGVLHSPNPATGCFDPQTWQSLSITYNDKNGTGMAGNLISQSNTVVLGSGPQTTALNNGGTVPSDGNVWAMFNLNSGNIQTKYSNGVTPIAFTYAGVQGSATPSPFPPWYVGANNSAVVPYMGVTYASNGGPYTLLGETNAITVSNSGKVSFPITATIPSSGNIWGAFETNDTNFGLRELTAALTGNIYKFTHSFGSGPNPISGDQNSTTPVWMQITYNNTPVNVSFKPMLHDGITPITSGKLYAIQNGAIISSAVTDNTGTATVSITPGTYNFTIFDDKNFAVYKELNTVVSGTLSKTVSTNDYPFNCVSPFTGYQSDFILRINDTDGTHITNITTPTCPSPFLTLSFSVTFTGNGQSGNTFSSSMLTSITTETYKANAKNFTVSGTLVPTTFTGTNLISNSFSIGSGLATTTKNFVISLGTTQVPTPGTGGGASPNLNPFPIPNNPCGANYVFDNLSQKCVIINPGNLPPPSTVCDDNHVRQGFQDINGVCTAPANVINVPIDCGGPNITIVTVVVPPNAGFEPILTPPFTYPCPDDSTTIPIYHDPGICSLGESLQPDGTCQIPPPANTCPADLLSCLVVSPPDQKLQLTAEKSDGSTVSLSVPIPNLGSPQLTSLAWLIIFVILFAVIGGYIYRKYFTKQRRKRKQSNGSSDTIQKFHKDLNRKYR